MNEKQSINSNSSLRSGESHLDSDSGAVDVADIIKTQPDPLIGTQLAHRYDILDAIATGGMGVIYRGRHILMDKIVAIKMLNSSYVNEPGALTRFQHEAKVASKLDHPNIVVVHDFGIADEKMLYLVMDFVEGQTLAQILDEKSCLPTARVLSIAKQLCDALGYAHSQDVIHRDLKPSNLMLVQTKDAQDFVKVLDFGLAKFLGEGKQQLLSQTGYVFGTGFYMSPEQCKGKPADVRSEIYSVGCVLYEAITGLPPLVGANLLETCQKHIEETPQPMSELRSDLVIPRNLEALVSKALHKNPSERYQSAAELRQALVACDNYEAPLVVKRMPSSVRLLGIFFVVFAIGLGSAFHFATGGLYKSAAVSTPIAKTGSNLNPAMFPDGSIVTEFPSAADIANSRKTRATKLPARDLITKLADPIWTKYYSEASIAFEKEKYGAAETFLNKAVTQARHSGNDTNLLVSLKKLEDALYVQQRYAEADKLNVEIQKLGAKPDGSNKSVSGTNSIVKNTLSGTNTKLVSVVTESREPQDERIAHLAMSCHKNGQCDTAVSLLLHSVKITKRVHGPRSLQTAARLSELVTLYMALDEPEKAQPLMDEVMEIKAENTSAKKANQTR